MPLKRPSTARRNINQEYFTSFVSCSRLRHVQSLLKAKDHDNKQLDHPDTLLCILGIDSRYNDGMIELVNYLLFGFYNIRREELERSGYAEEIIDDLIIVIKKDSVAIYCNPINYLYILPYVAHWKNLQIFCMTENQYKDDEAAEDFKVCSFVDMMKECRKIGIPFNSHGHQQKFDPFAIEKWPIIQAFALEDYGGGGFFTMLYEVVDVSSSLRDVYSLMDPVSVETLVADHLSLFQRQFSFVLANIDIHLPSRDMTEEAIFEPLKSYYRHGKFSASDNSESGISKRKPFLLFGSRASKVLLDKCKASIEVANQATISSAGTDTNSTALHMVCQAVSSKVPLSCARTYFFSSAHSPYPLGNKPKDYSEVARTNIRILNRAYSIVIETLLLGIQVYCQTFSCKEARKSVMEKLSHDFYKYKIPVGSSFFTDSNNVEFSIEAFSDNSSVELEEGRPSLLLKSACLSVHNVPSTEGSSKPPLGSLVFSETFLDSSIPVLKPDQSVSFENDCLILTEHVPRFVSYAASPLEIEQRAHFEEFIKNKDKHEEELGKSLIVGETAQILGDRTMANPEECKLYLFEKALICIHPRYGPIIVPRSHIQQFRLYDGSSPSNLAMLIVQYKPSLQQWMPADIHSKQNTLFFGLIPKTRAHRAFYSEALGSLRQESEGFQTLEIIEELPASVTAEYQELKTIADTTATVVPAHSFDKVVIALPHLKRFLEHFAASSVGHDPIPIEDLPPVLNRPHDSGTFTDDVILTIITGVEGSQKHTLGGNLISMAKEQSRWIVLKPPIELCDDAEYLGNLQTSLKSISKGTRRLGARASASARNKTRVLIVIPGYIDTVDVAQAIQKCNTDPDVVSSIRIGAITTCIDPLNAFLNDSRLAFPKLLDHCTLGWVNNVVFTSSTAVPRNSQLTMVQTLIRGANPQVAFILANNGEFTRNSDVDLVFSETAFSEGQLIRARHLGCPGWSTGGFMAGSLQPAMTTLCLKFPQPMERHRLMSSLRSLKSSLTKRTPFHGNVYSVRGTVKFTDNPNKPMDFNYITLSGYFKMLPTEIKPSPPQKPSSIQNGLAPVDKWVNAVAFSGCGLQEGQLKNWLRACARQKPERKSHRTRSDLTKEELKNIQASHHHDPLPSGWFYNGTQYVSMAGEKDQHHPELDKFVKEYLDGINKGIDEFNARIDKEKYIDLFEDS